MKVLIVLVVLLVFYIIIVRNKIVELCGDIPRIELFARQYADGWDCWGNEV